MYQISAQQLRQLGDVHLCFGAGCLLGRTVNEPGSDLAFLSPFGELLVIFGDPPHDCFRLGFFHFVCKGADFFGTHTPSARVVTRWRRHARSYTKYHRHHSSLALPSETADDGRASPQQLRQLRGIHRNPPRLVFGEGHRPVRSPFSLLLRFPILRFAADSDLFELANDFSSLS
jgi:hypothetical protein